MPLNLLKKYNKLLDIVGMGRSDQKRSLMGIFKRDFENKDILFRNKNVYPSPQNDGVIKMETLFSHLTTEMIDTKTRKREFDLYRSLRLHWVKYHLEENKKENMLLFSVKEPDGIRTYFYDKDEKYVLVLEPLRKTKDAYYLLTAYYVRGKDGQRNKMEKKYERRLSEVL